jgi:pyruvate/2-oxoglutarate dehydrogenase complex dihydrolipoamide dehydrogenase (E3) component
VGMTQRQAIERGIDARTASCAIADVAGATVTGRDIRGGVHLVIDAKREVLVGATFVGPDVGDMLHGATIAIVGQVPLERLRHAVPSFPSISEVWLKALENYDLERKER